MSDDKKQQVLELGRLNWSLRDIEKAVQVRRETASAHLKAAGIVSRPPRTRKPPPPPISGASKPASGKGVSTDPATDEAPKPASRGEVFTDLATTPVRPGHSPTVSACEPHRDFIEAALRVGRNAKAIWEDLVTQRGFAGGYASVKRFARRQRGVQTPEERVVIETAPGRKAQVDYGEARWCGTPRPRSTAARGSS